jgi:phosphonate transport system ATP-binding protein
MIKVAELNKTFANGVRAVRSVSLEIETGSFVVVLGPSGAGKSTLLRCINRLVVPDAGTVSVAGEQVTETNIKRLRPQMGMIFQQFNLVGRLNVITNVLVGRLCHLGFFDRVASLVYLFGKDECQLAERLLARVGLASKAWDRADRLSGGEQQRVGIARALAQQPRVILADEPVASLDPVTGETIMRLLKEICAVEKLTVIVSLHQVSLAQRFADRIIGMNSGQIVFDGFPGDLDAHALRTIYGHDVHEHEPPASDILSGPGFAAPLSPPLAPGVVLKGA